MFIPTEVKGKRTSYVMVDDGSAINVCPLQILPNLGVKIEELTKSDLVIRAYVKTGPCENWPHRSSYRIHRAGHPSHLCFVIGKTLVPCLGRSALNCASEGEVPF